MIEYFFSGRRANARKRKQEFERKRGREREWTRLGEKSMYHSNRQSRRICNCQVVRWPIIWKSNFQMNISNNQIMIFFQMIAYWTKENDTVFFVFFFYALFTKMQRSKRILPLKYIHYITIWQFLFPLMFVRAKPCTFFEYTRMWMCKLHKKTDFLDIALSYLLFYDNDRSARGSTALSAR